ncbi:MAG: DUF1330 domain-containing protein [Pelagimonas sp.]|nr:DUF1330 domain-containing protein [Pelagimonas sp.]
MGVYVIGCVTMNPDEPEAYQEYLTVTAPLLEKAGAKVLQHFAVADDLVGHKPAENVMIVQYPSVEAVHELFESPEYQGVIPVRDRAFSTYSVSLVS